MKTLVFRWVQDYWLKPRLHIDWVSRSHEPKPLKGETRLKDSGRGHLAV
jgi:hypothetical protein